MCLILVSCVAFADESAPSLSSLADRSDEPVLPPLAEEIFFSGPQDPAEAEAWRAGLKAWRTDRAIRLRYDGSQYDRPELAWTQQVFSQVQLLIWDRSFYDPDTGEYTVDKFLTETESRVGPIDAVLIWHVYPNLGVDDRNQFDLLRDLPGGVPALRQMVEQFHRRGVRVFFPIIAGQRNTRRRSGSLGSDFAATQRHRRRRDQFRHAGKHSSAFPSGFRRHRPSSGARTAV